MTTKRKPGGLTISIQTSTLPDQFVFSTKDLKLAQEHINSSFREYLERSLQAAYGLGVGVRISNAIIFPELETYPPIDPRVIELSQKTPQSASSLDELFKQAYSVLGLTLDQCIAYAKNDGSRIADLAYCIEVTKHWEATNLAQLRSQGLIPDDLL